MRTAITFLILLFSSATALAQPRHAVPDIDAAVGDPIPRPGYSYFVYFGDDRYGAVEIVGATGSKYDVRMGSRRLAVRKKHLFGFPNRPPIRATAVTKSGEHVACEILAKAETGFLIHVPPSCGYYFVEHDTVTLD